MANLDYVQLGLNIRMARIRRGLKQKELAELVNVTSQHISHIETARSKVGLPTLVDIAGALGTSVDALLMGGLPPAQGTALDGQLEELLRGAAPELKLHILKLCQEEVLFFQQLGGPFRQR